MTSRRNTVLFAVVAAAGMVAALIGAALFVGPALETAYLPVVTGAQFTVVGRAHDRMTVDWVAHRGREHCLFRGATALVYRNNEWHQAILSAAGDATDAPLPGNTVPAGFQRFRRLDVIPDGSALRVTLRHRCHLLWLSVTHIPAMQLQDKT